MNVAEVNQLDAADFVQRVGWVFEHSPWVARRAWTRRPFASLDELHKRMCAEVDAAAPEEQLMLLRAHPDLGTRAKMSDSSAIEQAGAGLDQLTRAEFDRLHASNEAYKRKFGFPFLYAVKGSGKTEILDALDRRLDSARDAEFEEALRQVYRIARFRLESIIER